MKHARHKALLSVWGNGLLGTLLVLPFAGCALPPFLRPDQRTSGANEKRKKNKKAALIHGTYL